MYDKITKIEVQKNNKERFNLFLDEVFEMGIDIDTLKVQFKKVKFLSHQIWRIFKI